MPESLHKPSQGQAAAPALPKARDQATARLPLRARLRHAQWRLQEKYRGFIAGFWHTIDELRSGFHRVLWAAFGVAAAIVLFYAGRTSFDAFLRALTGIGTLAIAVTVWRTTRAYYANTVLIADRKLRLDLHEKRVPLYRKLRKIIEEIDVKTWDRSIGIDSNEQYHALATRVRALADDITIYFADESLSRDVAGISAYVHDFVGTRMLNYGDRPDKEYFCTLGRRLADVNARMLRRVQLRDAL